MPGVLRDAVPCNSIAVHDQLPTVYVDESNNSGENLLDLNQPTYALAAVRADPAQAATVVEKLRAALPSGQAEPKYSSLIRSARGRSALLAAFRELPSDSISTFIANKRFMIVGKLVDLLAVEFAYENGYDMYADGSAVALANLIYAAGPVLGDRAAFERMLVTFVKASRRNRTATADDLMAAIAAYRATTESGFGEKIWMLETARAQAEEFVAAVSAGEVRDSLDPAVTSLVTVSFAVAEKFGHFNLVHDASTTIARNRPILESLETLVPVTPGLSPQALPVASIEFADSSTTPGLQIADWAAGATGQLANAREKNIKLDYLEELAPQISSWLVGGIVPDPDLITNPRRI
jgi:hypothetical protein